jgi:hypothetical protein
LTGRRTPLWRAKVVVGAALTLANALTLAFALFLLTGGASGWLWFAITPAVALSAFAWGLCVSPTSQNVLAAAGLAAILFFISLLIAGTLGNAVLLMIDQSFVEHSASPRRAVIASCVFQTVLTLGALRASWWIFCRDDRARNVDYRPSGSALRSLVWLTYRQGRTAAGFFLIGAIALYLLLALTGWTMLLFLVVWPFFTLLLGVMCGIETFAPDQGEGRRFLADQRLPAGRMWSAKTFTWSSIAVVIALTFLTMERFAPRQKAPWAEELAIPNIPGIAVLEVYHRSALFLVCWLLYGFAIGQFCILAFRRPVVATVVAILVSLIAVLWWPSLFHGGLHVWQILGPPLVLLARFVATHDSGSGPGSPQRAGLAVSSGRGARSRSRGWPAALPIESSRCPTSVNRLT